MPDPIYAFRANGAFYAIAANGRLVNAGACGDLSAPVSAVKAGRN